MEAYLLGSPSLDRHAEHASVFLVCLILKNEASSQQHASNDQRPGGDDAYDDEIVDLDLLERFHERADTPSAMFRKRCTKVILLLIIT